MRRAVPASNLDVSDVSSGSIDFEDDEEYVPSKLTRPATTAGRPTSGRAPVPARAASAAPGGRGGLAAASGVPLAARARPAFGTPSSSKAQVMTFGGGASDDMDSAEIEFSDDEPLPGMGTPSKQPARQQPAPAIRTSGQNQPWRRAAAWPGTRGKPLADGECHKIYHR